MNADEIVTIYNENTGDLTIRTKYSIIVINPEQQVQLVNTILSHILIPQKNVPK